CGRHLIDTKLDMQDHNLTLFPQSKLQFFLGYTGTLQNGPALSSMVFYNESGNVYPLFTDVHRVRNEYRAGSEFQILGFRVNWIHGWEDFKEDSPSSLDGPALVTGNSRIAISSFVSSQPYHGTSPYWRVAIFKNIKSFSLNGRFTYTSGARGFVTNEGTVGTTMFGSTQARQVLTYGDAQRPAATGNLTFSYSPFSRLTFVDSTAVYNIRTSGSSVYTEYDNATQASDTVNYEYLGIRTIDNQAALNYQAALWLGLTAGYNYTDRLIQAVTSQTSLITQSFGPGGGGSGAFTSNE